MTISSVNFAGKIEQPKTQQKGGAGKAVASAFIPGLGQLIDGRGKDGAKYFGGVVALKAASGLVGLSIIKKAAKAIEQGAENLPKTPVAKVAAMSLIGLASLGLWVANIVDAYKGGKQAKIEKVEEPVEEPVMAQKVDEEA